MSHGETALWQALALLQRLGSRLRTLDYRLGLGLLLLMLSLLGLTINPVHMAISTYLILLDWAWKTLVLLRAFSSHGEPSRLKKARQTPQPHSSPISLVKKFCAQVQSQDEGKYTLFTLKLCNGHSCISISQKSRYFRLVDSTTIPTTF